MKTVLSQFVRSRAPRRAFYAALGCLAASAPAIVLAATAVVVPAKQCLTDLNAFDTIQHKDGYWLDGGAAVTVTRSTAMGTATAPAMMNPTATCEPGRATKYGR